MATNIDVAWMGSDDIQNLERIIIPTPTSAQGEGVETALPPQQNVSPTDSWREVSEAVASDWPDHPQPLDAPAVMRRIEQLAATNPRGSRAIRRQVIHNTLGVIFQAFEHFDRSRRFNPWACRVLFNYGVSLYRGEMRLRYDSDFVAAVSARNSSRAEDDLAEVLHDFRLLCDNVRFSVRASDCSALTGVFALETHCTAGRACPPWTGDAR